MADLRILVRHVSVEGFKNLLLHLSVAWNGFCGIPRHISLLSDLPVDTVVIYELSVLIPITGLDAHDVSLDIHRTVCSRPLVI